MLPPTVCAPRGDIGTAGIAGVGAAKVEGRPARLVAEGEGEAVGEAAGESGNREAADGREVAEKEAGEEERGGAAAGAGAAAGEVGRATL